MNLVKSKEDPLAIDIYDTLRNINNEHEPSNIKSLTEFILLIGISKMIKNKSS